MGKTTQGILVLLGMVFGGCGGVGDDEGLGQAVEGIRNGTPLTQNKTGLLAFYFTGTAPCSAVYVKDRWALTARHCVENEAAGTDWPRAGMLLTSTLSPGATQPSTANLPPGAWARVSSIRKYSGVVDLALLKLSSSINAPIMPRNRHPQTNWLIGKTLLCQGYGWSQQTGPNTGVGAGNAREAKLLASSRAFPASEFQIVLNENGLDQMALPGDSGGPCFLPVSVAAVKTNLTSAIMLSTGGSNPDDPTYMFALSLAADTPWFDWIQSTIAQ